MAKTAAAAPRPTRSLMVPPSSSRKDDRISTARLAFLGYGTPFTAMVRTVIAMVDVTAVCRIVAGLPVIRMDGLSTNSTGSRNPARPSFTASQPVLLVSQPAMPAAA